MVSISLRKGGNFYFYLASGQDSKVILFSGLLAFFLCFFFIACNPMSNERAVKKSIANILTTNASVLDAHYQATQGSYGPVGERILKVGLPAIDLLINAIRTHRTAQHSKILLHLIGKIVEEKRAETASRELFHTLLIEVIISGLYRLDSYHPQTRDEAICMLREYSDPKDIILIEEIALKDPSAQVRQAAATALAFFESERTFPLLKKHLVSNDAAACMGAMQGILWGRVPQEPKLQLLDTVWNIAATTQNNNVLWVALTVLNKLDSHFNNRIKDMAISEPNAIRLHLIIGSLIDGNPVFATAFVQELLNNTNIDTERKAASIISLGSAKIDNARNLLANILRHPENHSEKVLKAALYAARVDPHPLFGPFLSTLASSHRDARIRADAVAAASNYISSTGPEVVSKAITDTSDFVRGIAYYYLARSSGPSSTIQLIQGLKVETKPFVRLSIASGLGAIGLIHAPTPELKKTLQNLAESDQDEKVRHVAFKSILLINSYSIGNELFAQMDRGLTYDSVMGSSEEKQVLARLSSALDLQ